jgi:predicted RNA-binding Zn-ribbon protein involved in translation (DUF1610 family)
MRLHAENPELSHEELTDLATRSGRQLTPDEPRYTHTCRKCGDEYTVDQRTQNWIESLGGRIPKCGDCYIN